MFLTQARDIVVTSIVSQRFSRLPLRLAPLIALGGVFPSIVQAQANYCDVLFCVQYSVPVSTGSKVDLVALDAMAALFKKHTYSYGVTGANATAITTVSAPAISLSNTTSLGWWGPLFPLGYYLHSAEYSNSAALVTSPSGHVNGPAVFLSSIGRAGDDGSNGGTFHSGSYGDDGYHGAHFGFFNSGSISRVMKYAPV
jgi:hypothetical protein